MMAHIDHDRVWLCVCALTMQLHVPSCYMIKYTHDYCICLTLLYHLFDFVVRHIQFTIPFGWFLFVRVFDVCLIIYRTNAIPCKFSLRLGFIFVCFVFSIFGLKDDNNFNWLKPWPMPKNAMPNTNNNFF